ncbi:MAG: DUF3237 family protein [Erythrobacter sp.]|nr:MAG: DUF3237 family protein [Erythrobacter sp.]
MRIALAATAMFIAAPTMAQEAPVLEHVFTITAELGPMEDLGLTGRGPRRIIPITGGTVEGERISGTIRPGAWDWQLTRTDGCTELEADYFIETTDGVVINVLNRATICPPAAGEAPGPIYTNPQFEPPLGEFAWLGRNAFVGRLELAQDHPVPAVRIAIFRVQ